MLSRRLRRWLIICGSLVLLVCAYAAFGFWGVPRLLRSNLQSFVTTHYHRQLGLGDIHFNPFALTLDLRSLSFPDTDGQPMLGFSRLFVDVSSVSIVRGAPSFKEITLEGPFTRVLIHPDGTLNLADLGKPFPPEPKPAKPAEPEKPMRLFIERLSIRGGRTIFEDRSKPVPFTAELTPISFDLRDFSTTGKTGNRYSLAGASELGERFKWEGSLEVTPVSSKGHFEVDNLQAHTLWSYARDSLGFEIPSGAIAVAGDYDFSTVGNPVALAVDVHSVSITNLGLRPRGQDANYIDLARVDVDDTHFDLEKKSVQVGKVKLAGGQIRAWRDAQGGINLMELAGSPKGASASGAPGTAGTAPGAGASVGAQSASGGAATPPPTPAAQASAGSPAATAAPAQSAWAIAMPDISVEALKVSAEDRQVSPVVAVTLDPINLHVAGFTTAPDAKLDIEADTSINKTAKLHAKASLTPGSGAVSAQTELKGLDLTLLQPYIAQQTSMTLLSGQLGTSLTIDRAADGALAVTGDADVAKLRTVDNALKKDFVKWDRLKVTGIDFHLQPSKLKIARIDAQGAYARVIIAPNQVLNITEILTAPGKAGAATAVKVANEAAPAPESSKKNGKTRKTAPIPAEPAGPAAPGMPMSIGVVNFINSSAHFADYWIQPNYAVAIQSLNGSVAGLSSDPNSRAKVKLEGKVDRYAPVHIDGELNLLAATAYTNIKMSFQGVDMSSVTPYSGRFAGYKIEKGKLTADLSYLVENRKLTADHHIVIDQLQLGEKVDSPDSVKLPLKLAIALLKDRNGVIDLGLPITGSLDDPQFRIAPLVWKVVVNLVEKAVTAPFALLGRLFGGGEEMNIVDFKAGSAALDDAAHKRMETLLKAMKERPGLELDVPMGFSPQLDKPVMAQRLLDRKLLAQQDAGAKGGKPGNAAKGGKPGNAGKGGKPGNAGQDGNAGSAAKRGGNGTSAGAESAPAAAPVGGPAPAAPNDEPELATFTDPAEHYRLLVAEHRAELGKDAPLPDSATAVEEAKKKKGETPAYDPAIADLQQALIARMDVSDSNLEELGRRRAHAIQDALLGGGEIEAKRVFLIDTSSKNDEKSAKDGKPPPPDVVRLELSLK